MNEQLRFQFRGIWLPAEIIEQFLDGSLNKTDLLILMIVESFVKNRGNGCFATNAYIAKSVGDKNKVYISQRISKLADLGLLKIVNKEVNRIPTRYLETCWSRLPNTSQENTKNEGGDIAPIYRGGLDSSYTPMYKENNTNNVSGRVASRNNMSSNHSSIGKVSASKEAKCIAKELHEVIVRHNAITTSKGIGAWPSQIQGLFETRQSEQVLSALRWLDKNWKWQWCPKVHCANSFVEKFPKIEEAIKRKGDWEAIFGEQDESDVYFDEEDVLPG